MSFSAHAQVVLNSLKIADAKTIGEILYSKGIYSNPHSARTNAQKQLKDLVDLGKIEYVKSGAGGFYRTLDCKSEYGEHARILTTCLAELLKLPLKAHIRREVSFPIGTRADAVVLLEKGNKGLVFVLEAAHTESHGYLSSKIRAWRDWKGATKALSELFRTPVPSFGFVVEGKHISGAIPFAKLMEELK